jgi:GNAT superfamily N-acetyltransferase
MLKYENRFLETALMSYQVSTATIDDLESVSRLINDYVCQNLGMPAWAGSIASLKRDYTSGCFRMNVIHSDDQIVGFAAWTANYDLHHCVHGALFIDFYIAPAYRCRGLGAALICAIAKEITALGWSYMRGQALSGRASRLYARVGVRFGANEYNVSGKALRQLASLAGKSAREIFQGLPPQAMNHED